MDSGKASPRDEMNRILDNHGLLLILRYIVGGTFLYAGILKIQNPQAFADSIATFQMVSSNSIGFLTLGLPPFEIMVGTLLLIGWQKRLAAFSILFLTVIFSLVLLQGLCRGLPIDCGCMGSGAPSLWKTWMSLGRDVLLIPAALVVYLRS